MLAGVSLDNGEASFVFSETGLIETAETDRVKSSAIQSDSRTDLRGRIGDEAIAAIKQSDLLHGAYGVERFAELKSTAQQIDRFKENFASDYEFSDVATSVVTVGGTSIVIGSVVTALRTGMLALGLLSQLPVWTLFDPLMVMDGVSGGDDGDSLQEIVDKAEREQLRIPETVSESQDMTQSISTNTDQS